MKPLGSVKLGLLAMSCLGMILPVPVLLAEEPSQPVSVPIGPMKPTVPDVALRPGGVLLGQAIDVAGKPLAKIRVSLRQGDYEVVVTRTDESGYFAAGKLRGGIYQIVAGPAQGVYRVWADKTAPPTAQPGALVTASGQRILGQQGPIGYWLENPVVIAGLVALAVAVPVVLHNHRLDRDSSP